VISIKASLLYVKSINIFCSSIHLMTLHELQKQVVKLSKEMTSNYLQTLPANLNAKRDLANHHHHTSSLFLPQVPHNMHPKREPCHGISSDQTKRTVSKHSPTSGMPSHTPLLPSQGRDYGASVDPDHCCDNITKCRGSLLDRKVLSYLGIYKLIPKDILGRK